jgi:large subunit ribosomal protein L31e
MADKKTQKESGPAEERLLTIPLRREWLKAPMNYRAKRSVTTIRGFLSKHMHVPLADVKISAKLNDFIWNSGAGKPPSRVRLKASLDSSTGKLMALLPDEKPPEAKKEEKKTEKPKEEKPPATGTEESKPEPAKQQEKPEQKKEEKPKTDSEKPKGK